MHQDKENQEHSKQPKFLDPFDDPNDVIRLRSATSIHAARKVNCCPRRKQSTSTPFQDTRRGLSDQEGLLGRSASELISLLRYTTFLPHGVVERWSRKVREIDFAQPKRGITVLDELLTDYWSVFIAFKPTANFSTQGNMEKPNFEIEMGQMKSKLDRLGEILLSMQNETTGADLYSVKNHDPNAAKSSC